MTFRTVVLLCFLFIVGALSQGDVGSIISKTQFDQMLKHRDDVACPGKGFYTYDAFVAAAKSFGAFGTTGATDIRKREIAAFLAQTSHETTGGWATAPDGPYAWGYCYKEEQGNPPDYCVANQQWPCVPGKKYYGRGPIQISYNYNYGPAGRAIGLNLLNSPETVANDPVVSFKTAFWFWMTPQSPKPSCHDVITGTWRPSAADTAAGRVPGYGVITNIINGGIECGKGSNPQVEDRIGSVSTRDTVTYWESAMATIWIATTRGLLLRHLKGALEPVSRVTYRNNMFHTCL
ncbi:unnamed protein product [Ilex paraguariensis]|uniref:Glycoside hydrolase family 19 catalytic domain-containing protein n=1 Tax=Ilex paraguariensis TaxID=185542 RepID=A0ABC8SJ52_9AQUA